VQQNRPIGMISGGNNSRNRLGGRSSASRTIAADAAARQITTHQITRIQ
jgi:hypothetical protein